MRPEGDMLARLGWANGIADRGQGNLAWYRLKQMGTIRAEEIKLRKKILGLACEFDIDEEDGTAGDGGGDGGLPDKGVKRSLQALRQPRKMRRCSL